MKGGRWFISFAAQIIADAEALNMVESIGNYTRHRRVPVVAYSDGSFKLRYVPAVSGESLAHAYQSILVDLALASNIPNMPNMPVCEYCGRKEFVKHAVEELFGSAQWEVELKDMKDPHLIEKKILENCVVEDVGGFLYTTGVVKRTSRIGFSYMVPSKAFLASAALEPQFHVRHVPSKPERRIQMIYYVETGSAIYALSGYLDLCNIGCTSMVKRECLPDAKARAKLAVKALGVMLTNAEFGAKRSRFFPNWELLSLVVAVSSPVKFNVTPPHSTDFIKNTVERAKRYKEELKEFEEEIKVFFYINPNYENALIKPEGVTSEPPEEIFTKLEKYAEECTQ